MKLGHVVATVVSTISAPAFDGRRLLICDVLDPDLSPAGGYVIAVDTVGAGAGEIVLIHDEGNGARQILGDRQAPVRTLVVGIVDAVEVAPDGERRSAIDAIAPPRPTASPPSTDVASGLAAGPAARAGTPDGGTARSRTRASGRKRGAPRRSAEG